MAWHPKNSIPTDSPNRPFAEFKEWDCGIISSDCLKTYIYRRLASGGPRGVLAARPARARGAREPRAGSRHRPDTWFALRFSFMGFTRDFSKSFKEKESITRITRTCESKFKDTRYESQFAPDPRGTPGSGPRVLRFAEDISYCIVEIDTHEHTVIPTTRTTGIDG